MFFNVEGIEFSYGSTPTLNDVSFNVKRKEMLALLGPNGTGKTTLLKCINRVLVPHCGNVIIDDKELHEMRRIDAAKEIGYVPQRGDVSRMTVFDAVLLGRRPHIEWEAGDKDLRLTSKVIELMGLSDLSMKYIDEISGGEYQLVQIARALTQQPKVILMDEPTSNLDISNQHSLMKMTRKIVQINDMSTIMTMHDLNLAIRYSDRFVMMHNGRIYAAGGHEVLTPENIKAVYHIDAYVEEIKGIPIVIPK